MNRPRKKDRHLPRCVYAKHGAYWHVKGGKWTKLGTTLTASLEVYARLYEVPQGGMGKLIDTALEVLKPTQKSSTVKQYEGAAKILKKAFLEFAPEQVKPKDVAAFKVARARTPNMANRCLSLLRQVFDYALEQQIPGVESNPAIGVKRHKESKRTRLISIDEYVAIYAESGPRLQVIMDLLIRTGERINDVLKIRRADLLDEGIRFVQQKTGAKRTVSSTPELDEVIARAKVLNGNIRALTLLHNRKGKAPDYRTVQLQWDKACKRAGVVDANLHDLRAVAATWARKQGMNATKLLGHSSPAQTERYLRDREEVLAEGPSFRLSIDNAKKLP
ncbi:MAG: integrase [Gammaproteobacteria bacterium]|nr:integrase [Gammaproteobacteria bacterium]